MTKHHRNILLTVVILCVIWFYFPNNLYLSTTAVLLAFLFFLVRGVFDIQSNYFMKSLHHSPINKCILTFDDGPSPETIKVLDILEKHQLSAIFFVVGEQLKQNPHIAKLIIEKGHLLGNHSYSHSSIFPLMSTKNIKEELVKVEDLLGEHSLKLFRPPIGISNPRIARVVRDLKLKSIGWSIRSFDTKYVSTKKLLERLLRKTKYDSIILFHDNQLVTAKVLDQFILEAKKKGVSFTTSIDLKNAINH